MTIDNYLAEAEDVLREAGFALPIAWASPMKTLVDVTVWRPKGTGGHVVILTKTGEGWKYRTYSPKPDSLQRAIRLCQTLGWKGKTYETYILYSIGH